MRLALENMPLTQDITGAVIPPEELTDKAIVAFACSIDNIYNIERFRGRSYTFLLRVTATLIMISEPNHSSLLHLLLQLKYVTLRVHASSQVCTTPHLSLMPVN